MTSDARSRRQFLKSTALVGGLPFLSGVEAASQNAMLPEDISATFTRNSVTFSGATEMCYAFGDVPFKPYMREFRTPSGVNILRDAPHDHLHHHGLMFACQVDGVDFWVEAGEPIGQQKHVCFSNVEIPPEPTRTLASFTEQVHWQAPGDDQPLLRESRSIWSLPRGPENCAMLTWRGLFVLNRPEATLTGHHYHGLGMRFVESMDSGGQFFSDCEIDGVVVRGDERNFKANWCAYRAAVNSAPVTVAIFDHPRNPRRATFFTMGDASPAFAYLAVTLNLHKEPLVWKSGQRPKLRYGIALWDGHKSASVVSEAYAHWLKHNISSTQRTPNGD